MNIAKPRISDALTEVSDFSERARESLHQEKAILYSQINDAHVEGERFSKLELQESRVERGLFQGCHFDGTTFVDVEWNSCDFSNCSFVGAYFERCVFLSCKWAGANLGEALIKNCTMEQCNFQYAYFDQANFTDVCLKECDFLEASFSDVKFKRMEIQQSHFVRNNFFKTKLAGIDFRGNELVAPGISNCPTELKGIKLDPLQAVGLVSLLGVLVEE